LAQVFKTSNHKINGLEFLASVIILCTFSGGSNFVINSETIEHKLNLILILFDFRDTNKITLEEIIIMSQTALTSVNKVV
jgi:hypothetical protein